MYISNWMHSTSLASNLWVHKPLIVINAGLWYTEIFPSRVRRLFARKLLILKNYAGGDLNLFQGA